MAQLEAPLHKQSVSLVVVTLLCILMRESLMCLRAWLLIEGCLDASFAHLPYFWSIFIPPGQADISVPRVATGSFQPVAYRFVRTCSVLDDAMTCALMQVRVKRRAQTDEQIAESDRVKRQAHKAEDDDEQDNQEAKEG